MQDSVQTAAAMRSAGGSLDDVLHYLRGQGASIVQCVKFVREAEGVGLGEAKVLVDESSAWADVRESNARLRSALLDAGNQNEW